MDNEILHLQDEVKYAYFFTRQDIYPEYQLVQTAHVALKLGWRGAEYAAAGHKPTNPRQHFEMNPDETYFTCVGVRNLDALNAVADILEKFGFEYVMFYEPDLNGGEATSIGVFPVDASHKGVLEAFSLLRFGSKG